MVEITHIKPIISKNPNVTPIKIIANIVAETGSTQAIILALVGPIIVTPVKYNTKAAIVPENIIIIKNINVVKSKITSTFQGLNINIEIIPPINIPQATTAVVPYFFNIFS